MPEPSPVVVAQRNAAKQRARDLTRALYRAQEEVTRLADDRREALRACVELGCTWRETARACGVSVKAVVNAIGNQTTGRDENG